jgi:hypothetical protein
MKNSHQTLIIVVLCGLISLPAEAQQRRRSSSKPKRTTTAQITPLQAFIGATGELNNIWRITYVVETPNEAIEMTTTILNLAVTSLGDNEELRNLVSKTGEAYLDALWLRSNRLKFESLPTTPSESIYRQQRVSELRAAKDRYYREYDDPVARERNRASWEIDEIAFKREFSEEGIAERARRRELELAGRINTLNELQADADAMLLKHGIRGKYELMEGHAEDAVFEVAKTRRLEVIRKSGGRVKK